MEVLTTELGIALILLAITGVVQRIIGNTHMKRMREDIAELKEEGKTFRENIYTRLGAVEITIAEIRGSSGTNKGTGK